MKLSSLTFVAAVISMVLMTGCGDNDIGSLPNVSGWWNWIYSEQSSSPAHREVFIRQDGLVLTYQVTDNSDSTIFYAGSLDATQVRIIMDGTTYISRFSPNVLTFSGETPDGKDFVLTLIRT